VGLGVRPAEAAALAMTPARPLTLRGEMAAYALPAADGAVIDRDREVIVVRWQGRAFAFSLSCPHQRTMLRWQPAEARFQCPKHHSRYQPEGTFVSGRATRGMDRYAVRLEGNQLAVDLSRRIRQDQDPAAWTAAAAVI
jgi:Rieske Fe-S protein